MSDCPMWRVDCQVRAAAKGTQGAIDGVGALASGTSKALDVAGGAAGKVGFLLPFLVLVGIIWLGLKLARFGGNAAIGAGDHLTRGAVSGVLEQPVRRSKPSSAGGKGKTGARSTGSRQGGTKARAFGANAAEAARARRSAGRGLQVEPHTGQAVELIDRRNGRDGKPTQVVVCAPDGAQAMAMLTARMVGHRWSFGANRKCDVSPKSHKHFTIRRH